VSRYRNRSGIVVRRHKTPNGDIIISLLTPEGKLKGICRAGARSHHASRLNLFQHLTVQTYERPHSDLLTLNELVLEGALPGLSDPSVYPFAHFLAELADKMYQESDFVGQAGFELFSGGLRGLVRHEDPDRVTLVIAWKLLALHGLFPRVHACLDTNDVDNLTHFDAGRGGVTSARVGRGLRVGTPTIEELNLIARGTVREVLELELEPEAREGLWAALEAYLTAQIGALKSLGALRLLRHTKMEKVENLPAFTLEPAVLD
jgi:DNA repair protein RecO (recombination protein O)